MKTFAITLVSLLCACMNPVRAKGLRARTHRYTEEDLTALERLEDPSSRAFFANIVNYHSERYLFDNLQLTDDLDALVPLSATSNPHDLRPVRRLEWRFRIQDNCPNDIAICVRIQSRLRFGWLFARDDDSGTSVGAGTIDNDLQNYDREFAELIWSVERVDCEDGSGLLDCAYLVNVNNMRRLFAQAGPNNSGLVGSIPDSSPYFPDQKWRIQMVL